MLPHSTAPPETRVRGGAISWRLQLCANHEGPGLHDLETREAPALVRGAAFGASPGIAGRQGAARGSVQAPRGHASQPPREATDIPQFLSTRAETFVSLYLHFCSLSISRPSLPMTCRRVEGGRVHSPLCLNGFGDSLCLWTFLNRFSPL